MHDTIPNTVSATSNTGSIAAPPRAAAAVEVRVAWGHNLLSVTHLAPLAPFVVGEAEGRGGEVDFVVPREALGAVRLALVEVVRGSAYVAVPPGASGFVTTSDTASRVPVGEVGGRVALHEGTRVRLEVGALVFEVTGVAPSRKLAGAVTLAALVTGSAVAYVIGAGVGVGGLLAAMAFVTPDLGASTSPDVTDDKRYLIARYLDAAAERERDEAKNVAPDVPRGGNARETGGGARASGEGGVMGTPNARTSGRRAGVAGPQENEDPHLARQAALRDAASFGIIGLLDGGGGGDPDAPTSPWGREESLGNDPLSARGGMWGDAIGESGGVGGLDLTGIGEGGGGRGVGFGLGPVGTVGHGGGNGRGSGLGFAGGVGGVGLAVHRTKAPVVRMGVTAFQGGRIPPEVIQATVRANFGRFRLCYENGLRQNPNLEGTVSVRFVIGRDGGVSSASGGGSLPDAGVVACVARSFSALSFPAPDGGVVTVSYPIAFHPG